MPSRNPVISVSSGDRGFYLVGDGVVIEYHQAGGELFPCGKLAVTERWRVIPIPVESHI